MRKNEPKYFDVVRKMMIHISTTYGYNEFTYNDICEWLTKQGHITIILSKVCYAGGVVKVRRGVYKLQSGLIDVEGMLRKIRITWGRKSEVEVINTIQFPNNIKEEDAIAILKARGYKILKPISQYEEI